MAAHAAVAAGISLDRLTSLASLVELDTFRALLRYRWQADGKKLSSYTHNLAVALTVIADEWVQLPVDKIAKLKTFRAQLGAPPTGLTEKNKALLRNFDDPRLLSAMLNLPDRLWQNARRGLTKCADLSSIYKVPLLSISFFTLRCGCKTCPRWTSTFICTGRRGAANLRS